MRHGRGVPLPDDAPQSAPAAPATPPAGASGGAPSVPAGAPEAPVVEEVRLSREMGLLDSTMLGVGALMGGGIFVLVGLAADVAGPALVLAFALNALITIPTLLVYAELGSAFHDAGGGYLWVKEALQQPWGFLGGWISWFSHAVACALYSLASGVYFVIFLKLLGVNHEWLLYARPFGFHSEIPAVVGFAIAFAAIFTGLNVRGIKQSVRVENTITALVLVVIFVFIGAGLNAVWNHPERLGPAFANAFPHGFGGVLIAMGLIVVAFEGFEIIAQSSEEVKNPKRNIPRAIFLSMILMAPIYLLITFVALAAIVPPAGLASWEFLAGSGEHALVDAAAGFMPFGVTLVLVAALLSNLTALNATIYSSSRVSFAMGRDRNLPGFFGRVSTRRQTPSASIIASGVIIVIMAVVLPIEAVAAAASIMFLLLFFLVHISFIKLRHTTKHLDYGYRLRWFPAMPLLGILGNLLLAGILYFYAPQAWYAALAWLGVGLVVYYGYARPRERPLPKPAPEHATAHEETAQSAPRPKRILLPVANPRHVDRLATAAANLGASLNAEVHLLYVVAVPRMLPLSEGRQFVERSRPVLDEGKRIVEAAGVPVHLLVRIGHDIPKVIRATAEEKAIDLILLGWRGEASVRDYVLGSTLDPLVADPPCDVAVLKIGQDEVSDVLVPTQGGRHAQLCVRLGSAVAKRRGVRLTLFALVPPKANPLEAQALLTALVADASLPGTDVGIKVVEGANLVSAVAAESRPTTLVVLGATEQPFWRQQLFGDKPEAVARRLPAVLLVKSRTGRTATLYRRLAERMKKWGEYLVPEESK